MASRRDTEQRELLTVEEVAEELRLHPHTIRNWIRTGRLPAKKYGRSYRIRKQDLQALLDSDEGGGSIGSNRNAWAAETFSAPYRPHEERPSPWEPNKPVLAPQA